MKKTFKMKDLECANCASKMENAILKIEGVEEVNISFLTQKLKLVADDVKFENIVNEVEKIIKKIEPDCKLVR